MIHGSGSLGDRCACGVGGVGAGGGFDGTAAGLGGAVGRGFCISAGEVAGAGAVLLAKGGWGVGSAVVTLSAFRIGVKIFALISCETVADFCRNPPKMSSRSMSRNSSWLAFPAMKRITPLAIFPICSTLSCC